MAQKYSERYSCAEDWFKQAREMFIVSKLLRDAFIIGKKDIPRTDEMLERSNGLLKGTMLFLGFAMENALKGACIRSAAREKVTQSHKLGDLAKDLEKKTNIKFSDDDMNLLDRLTVYVRWAGRYHIPVEKDADQLGASKKMVIPSDFSMVERMLTDMEVIVNK